MARLVWSAVGSKTFEAGVDRGVLYLDGQGVSWNGITGVNEEPTGGDSKPYYQDGVKYLNISAREEYEATLTAFTYPMEFAVCDGSARVRPGLFLGHQRRKSFGFSYRTKVGNDLEGIDFGYKIHLVYNALAEPSTRGFTTLGKDTDVSDFSWKITTKPLKIPGYNATAHMTLDSRYIHPITLGKLEAMLYGDDDSAPSLPSFEDILAQLDEPIAFALIDNEDGTFEIDGPNDILTEDNGVFTLDWPTATDNGDGTYTIDG